MAKVLNHRHFLLPGIIPRLVTFLSSGFGYTAYLIAIIFEAARILPAGHTYIDPNSINKFGIRHVLAQGANHLVFKWSNIDKIILYACVIGGLILLLFQTALLIVALIAQEPAIAQIIPFKDMFRVTSIYNSGPDQDLAFMTLDRVFGVQDIFKSCVSEAGVNCPGAAGASTAAFPYPQHKALHAMFEFYSRGIFVVSIIIILYFIIALVTETAATGVPFGQRTNKTWYPVRLILFFALLLPLNSGGKNAGLNGAQIITLWTAKIGSNFGTNGWGYFNDQLGVSASTTYLGESENLIATPNYPNNLGPLIQFMFIAKTCQIAEELLFYTTNRNRKVQGYVVREPQTGSRATEEDHKLISVSANTYEEALKFSNGGTIQIRFGIAAKKTDPDAKEFESFKGHVNPVCGELAITPSTGDDASLASIKQLQEVYYRMIWLMFYSDPFMGQRAECVIRKNISRLNDRPCPDPNLARSVMPQLDTYNGIFNGLVSFFVSNPASGVDWSVSKELRDRGWAGSAMWYNRVAELNGVFSTAIQNTPKVIQHPIVMEEVAAQRQALASNVEPSERFNPRLPNGADVAYSRNAGNSEDIATALYAANKLWSDSLSQQQSESGTGNVVLDWVNKLFGTNGMFEMRRGDNKDVHPLAQLSSLGRSMMEASARNIGIGILGAEGGALAKGSLPGDLANISGSFLKTMGMITFAMSFVLFYILPFLPFIYIFFAMSAWIKGIFEAMVAMPLWALAHISRIDGEGMIGPAAINGYIFLFDIFLRPILIIVGLLGSIIIFGSLVAVLNDIFEIVVENVSGFNITDAASDQDLIASMRAPLDQFFYTVLYTIIVYLMGINAFKLIDSIPEALLRYMNFSIKTFQENANQQTSEVLSKSYKGAAIATQDLQGGTLAALAYT